MKHESLRRKQYNWKHGEERKQLQYLVVESINGTSFFNLGIILTRGNDASPLNKTFISGRIRENDLRTDSRNIGITKGLQYIR